MSDAPQKSPPSPLKNLGVFPPSPHFCSRQGELSPQKPPTARSSPTALQKKPPPAGSARESSPPPEFSRPPAHSSRSAQSRLSRGDRRTKAKQYSPCPAQSTPRLDCVCRRSSGPKPPPKTKTRLPPASPP